MRNSFLLAAMTGVVATGLTARADIPIRAQRVATGLGAPIFATPAPGRPNELFIAEKGSDGTANIKILNLLDNTISSTPFISISGLATDGEQGLLGLAFHPNYATNGQFFVKVISPGGQFSSGVNEVRRYTRSAGNPNLADPNSAQLIISHDQPQTNHDGGWIGFGPNDGYLYIANGDGGGGNDEGPGHTDGLGNAQDITDNLMGKILRLDIDGDEFPADANRNYRIPRGGPGQPAANPFASTTGDDEIWSYGLRNPWRASFDRQNGDLYIGDVGQTAFEEVDYQPAASSGGENYGWRAVEGFTPTGLTSVPSPKVDPIYAYDRDTGVSITGGYVYRGNENAALNGTYIFADFGLSRIFTLRHNGTAATQVRNLTGQIPVDAGTMDSIASFAEDAQGRLYAIAIGGDIYRLIPALPGDADLSRAVNLDDFTRLASNFGQTGRTWANGDFTDDGLVNLDDFTVLAANFGGTQPSSPIPEPMTGLVLNVLAVVTRRTRR